jgi:hypothetical protein
MSTTDTERRWQQFEDIGEIRVRQNIAARIYGGDNTLAAREWLAHKERTQRSEEESRNVDSNSEQIRIARSAKNAAWAAAIAAIIAAICAATAIWLSLIKS